jgi:hypothetical protein
MSGVSGHIRSNVIGYVALFFALTGGAFALEGKNTVDSGDIKAKNVKRGDLARNSVVSSKVLDGSLTGADVDEGSLGQVPIAGTANSANTSNTAGDANTLDSLDSADFLRSNEPADGDLTGNYPNLELRSGTIQSADVASNFIHAEALNDDDAGHARGWNPDSARTEWTIHVPSLDSEDAAIALSLQDRGAPNTDAICGVTDVSSEGTFTVRCDQAVVNTIGLNFVIVNP